MARRYAPLMCAIWDDETFRSLSSDAQRLYMFLLSQRKMSMVGLLPLTPRAWARFASDLDQDIVQSALAELDVERFVVIDEDTQELLIRTVVTHDPPRGVKSIAAAWRVVDLIESDVLRQIVVDQLPGAAESVKPLQDAPSDAPSESVPMGDSEIGNAPSDGARVRARAATGPPVHPSSVQASSSDIVQEGRPQAPVDNPDDDPERARTTVTNLAARFTERTA